jgi:hypothetical protein
VNSNACPRPFAPLLGFLIVTMALFGCNESSDASSRVNARCTFRRAARRDGNFFQRRLAAQVSHSVPQSLRRKLLGDCA